MDGSWMDDGGSWMPLYRYIDSCIPDMHFRSFFPRIYLTVDFDLPFTLGTLYLRAKA